MRFREKIAGKKAGIILFLLCAFIAVSLYIGFRAAVLSDTDRMLADMSDGAKYDEDFIYVHVKGAVKKPGVYKLDRADRITDAVDAAGGFTEDADQDRINLASFLEDGSEIIIPAVTDDIDDDKININTADKYELMSLDGIGESYAERIIEYREQNGAFLNIDSIKNIDGISENKFSKIKDKIKVE